MASTTVDGGLHHRPTEVLIGRHVETRGMIETIDFATAGRSQGRDQGQGRLAEGCIGLFGVCRQMSGTETVAGTETDLDHHSLVTEAGQGRVNVVACHLRVE
jgi:hypothetical protein